MLGAVYSSGEAKKREQAHPPLVISTRGLPVCHDRAGHNEGSNAHSCFGKRRGGEFLRGQGLARIEDGKDPNTRLRLAGSSPTVFIVVAVCGAHYHGGLPAFRITR